MSNRLNNFIKVPQLNTHIWHDLSQKFSNGHFSIGCVKFSVGALEETLFTLLCTSDQQNQNIQKWFWDFSFFLVVVEIILTCRWAEMPLFSLTVSPAFLSILTYPEARMAQTLDFHMSAAHEEQNGVEAARAVSTKPETVHSMYSALAETEFPHFVS